MATATPHDPEAAIRALATRWSAKRAGRPLYRVRDWMLHFETSDTRKIRRLSFVPIPNKHDGKGYARVTALERPEQLLWGHVAICQIASKAPARGYLADEDGPFTAADLAAMTRTPIECFERAFAELVNDGIEWLEEVPKILLTSPGIARDYGRTSEHAGDSPDEPTHPRRVPEVPGDSPGNSANSWRKPEKVGEIPVEGKGIEVYPLSSPGGGQVGAGDSSPDPANVDSASTAAEKKENRGAAIADVIQATVAGICALFDRKSNVLSASAMHGLQQMAAGLPLDALKWSALRRMREARKKCAGQPDDLRLRARWLTNAEALAENLLGAAESAVEWCREQVGGSSSADGRTEKKAGPEPDGWREWLLVTYPRAAVPGSFYELPAELRREFERNSSGNKPVTLAT
jgi:hypothetical protein